MKWLLTFLCVVTCFALPPTFTTPAKNPQVQSQAAGGASSLNTGSDAYWKSEDLTDSRNANTLTDSGSTGFTAAKINNGFNFGGTTVLSRADNAQLSASGGAITISCWVNLGNDAATRYIVSKWNSGANTREYLLGYDAGADRFVFFGSNDGVNNVSVTANSFGAVATGTTYLITAGCDGTTLWIEVRSTATQTGTRDTATLTGGIRDDTSTLFVGAFDATPSGPWIGWIDEVGIWTRSLSTSETAELFNSDSGKTCCPFAP